MLAQVGITQHQGVFGGAYLTGSISGKASTADIRRASRCLIALWRPAYTEARRGKHHE